MSPKLAPKTPEVDPVFSSAGSASRVYHYFSCWLIQRRVPDVGDVALCGHIKESPRDAGVSYGQDRSDLCDACVDLWKAGAR